MRISKLLAAAVAILTLAVLAWSRPAAENGQVVSVSKRDFAAARLGRLGLDALMEKDGRVYLVVSTDECVELTRRRVPFTDETRQLALASLERVGSGGGVNGAFHSPYEMENDLRLLVEAHPGLATLNEIGRTLEGRPIYALKISDNAAVDEHEPAVLFTGCHHAREWISVEVPYLFGAYLLEAYASDAAVRALVDASEVWIVPIANPDGLQYTLDVYRYWRKNRRANADGTFGVDINRNYGYAWGFDDAGSSPQPGSDVYRGAAPFSEPETAAVRGLIQAHDIRALISFHSFGQDILYPWGFTAQPAPTDAEFGAVGRTMAGLIEAVNGTVYVSGEASRALYVTNGDLVDWAYSLAGAPSYTIELPPVDVDHGGFFNDEAAISAVFEENRPAMLYLVRYAIDHPLPGRLQSPLRRERRSLPAGPKPKLVLREP
ncbi:MAG TPA: M14 family metallopeptidase [Candidatus Bathyarchaeia archaeon]|nr:M14 family metallopeptidase [Candidatus Bathyarchaeia archaeon]